MKKPSDFRDWSLDDPDYPDEKEGCGILWLLALLAAAGLAALIFFLQFGNQ